MSCCMANPTKMSCAPGEYSDRPGHPPNLIRVTTVRMKKPWVLIATHWAHSEDSGQSGWMPRLIWVFAGCTYYFACFVMFLLKWSQWIPVERKGNFQLFKYWEINYVLLYLIMLFWNVWHVKIYLQWPIIYGKYGLGWQWPMLHNTLTVAEWANLWEVENVYCKYRMTAKYCSIKWLENYFSDEQKQEDAEAAAHFHIKAAAKIAQVIIILRTFALENLISIISFLLEVHSIFMYSIAGFLAIDYPPPPHPFVPTRHLHILCKICEHIYIYRQKLLLAQGGGGERYARKPFLISIYFIVKNTVSAQN